MTSPKVILVTGASRGIGDAIVNTLLTSSSSACILATARTTSALSALSWQYPDRVAAVEGNMTDPTLPQRAVDTAMQRWGRLDGLVVNHAVVEPVARIGDAVVEEWKAAFDVNVFSVIALLKAALPALRVSRGTILLTSSGRATKGTATWGSYCASKSVLNSLARTVALEEPEVTVVAIRPGVVDTEMQDVLRDRHYGTMEKEDVERFVGMRERGEMLRPEQPGGAMGRLVLNGAGGLGLSGEFVDWNDERLRQFQGS